MSATSAAIGRAAFRAVHAKTGGVHPPKKGASRTRPHGSNAAIIKEALRSLDPEQSKIEAAKNPNIVLADEALNENWVNDGQGSMNTATAFEEAIDYLASRNAQLFRKQTANDYELSELVVHLPANMCVEDTKNVSYVLDDNGSPVLSAKTGEPLIKPRLVPRDHVEARRYFDDALVFLIEHGVIVGGIDGVHWRSDQYSEHRPHMQVGFDNYAADPKHPGHLRNEFSRKWFSHREVRYPEGHPKAGKSISGKVKLSGYQTAMRDYMITRGWPVAAEIDQAQEGVHRSKAAHASNDNARIIAEDRLVTASEKEESNRELAAELGKFSEELAAESATLRLKRSTAARDGYAEGTQQGLAQGLREAEEVFSARESAIAERERRLGVDQLVLSTEQRRLREEQEQLEAVQSQLAADTQAQRRALREEVAGLEQHEGLLLEREQHIRELSNAYKAGLDEMRKRGIKPTVSQVHASVEIKSAQARLRAAHAQQAAQQHPNDAGHGLDK